MLRLKIFFQDRLKKKLATTGFFILILTVFLSSCSLVKQGKEFQTLFHCKYTLQNVRVLEVAGVDVSELGRDNEASSEVYFALLKKMFTQKISSKFEFTIRIDNPTEKPAGAQGMEWKMYVKDELFSEGIVDTAIYVAPKKYTSFKINADIDLFTLLNNISIGAIMDLLSTNDWEKVWAESGLEIKIKPWYRLGDSVKKYPGYFTIKP
jgi:hypothetical protein